MNLTGVTQLKIAKELGIKSGYISMIRTGERTPSRELEQKMNAILKRAESSQPVDRQTLAFNIRGDVLRKMQWHAKNLDMTLEALVDQACFEFIEKRAKTTYTLGALPAHSLNEPSPAEQRKEAEASGNVIDRKTILGA